ncbi:MAG TPA: GNAT family N-acetyltransferase [Gryllotalpicola sp.]
MALPSSVSIRGFRPGDGTALVGAWNRAAPRDPITEGRFRELVLLDRNFDAEGLLVARRDERVIGAIFAVRRQVAHFGDDLEASRGWVPFFFVVPEERGAGVGRALVTGAQRWLAAHGATEVWFSSYTPNYVLPGLDRERYPEAFGLLTGLGFATVERPSSMQLSLDGYAIPEEVAAATAELRRQGWRIGTPEPDEIPALIELAGVHFNSDWARAIREGLLTGMPVERIVIAVSPAGEVIGWAMHATYEGVIDRFGPFGVLPSSRGTGLGKVLLHATLERMVASGAHTAWFLWADEGTVASSLYLKTGFRITRTFDIMRADLPAAPAHEAAQGKETE